MTVTAYTVRGGTPGTCARCRGKLREGEAAEAVVEPGYIEHRHADCPAPAEGAPNPAEQLMADIRAGKPPANPDPEDLKRKVQGA